MICVQAENNVKKVDTQFIRVEIVIYAVKIILFINVLADHIIIIN